MDLAEIAARAEQAVDTLTIALNDQPPADGDTEEVLARLRSIVHGVQLGVLTLDRVDDGVERAADALVDSLHVVLARFDVLAESVQHAEDQQAFAA
jgi:hypothetical protein